MPIVHLKGRVLPFAPGAFAINIKDLPALNWTDGKTGQAMTITTRIDMSVIDVEFDLQTFDEADLPELMKRAWDLSRAAVDLYCFKVGWGLGVIIDSIVRPDGTPATIIAKNEVLAPFSTALDSSQPGINNYDVCYRLLVTEPPLFMALNDLIASITIPHHASTNCARVIEGLRTQIAPGMDRKKAWAEMRSNLNVETEYLTFITDLSTGPRHGDRGFIPGPTVTEVVSRTWQVMNRFLEFRKRGNKSLPIVEFPLLKN